MYIHIVGHKIFSGRHRGRRQSRHRALHAFPACVPKPLSQPAFRTLPIRLSRCEFSHARPREAEQALSSVFPGPHAKPSLIPQQLQRSGQRRTIHGKAGAQTLLVRLAGRGQSSEQAELGDFESRLPQFQVIDPRYDSSDAPQVLACARQVKECYGRLLCKGCCCHSRCIYILIDSCQAREQQFTHLPAVWRPVPAGPTCEWPTTRPEASVAANRWSGHYASSLIPRFLIPIAVLFAGYRGVSSAEPEVDGATSKRAPGQSGRLHPQHWAEAVLTFRLRGGSGNLQ